MTFTAHAPHSKISRVLIGKAKGIMSTSDGSSSVSDVLCSPPVLYSESRGSSVSSGMREEYEDLLRFAVVMPAGFDAKKMMASGGGGAETTPQPEPVPVTQPSLRPEGTIQPLATPLYLP